jgi:hypothetical protein
LTDAEGQKASSDIMRLEGGEGSKRARAARSEDGAECGCMRMSRFEDKSRVPGNLGFDPLKFGENTETRERLEMAELKNGRLAMLAFAGMIHQTFVTGKPILASLGDIFASP